MARFARDCIGRMNDLVKLLEVALGPDTGDLAIRVGLHSGPVTAGVLRGEKARFQLFGDTVNTAARMESNGVRNKIHISSETADQLRTFGKAHWLVPREEKVVAKGKGELTTFWLELKIQSSGSATSKSTESSEKSMKNVDVDEKCLAIKKNLARETAPESQLTLSPKAQRLVRWNVEIICRLLKQVVSRRMVVEKNKQARAPSMEFQIESNREEGTTVIDEVKEIIELPEFDPKTTKNQHDPASIQLDPKVEAQLYDYCALIASLYRNVPFHNVSDTSWFPWRFIQVLLVVSPLPAFWTLSVRACLTCNNVRDEAVVSVRLPFLSLSTVNSFFLVVVVLTQESYFSSIVAPDEVLSAEEDTDEKMDQNLHDHTYGITSDPLTQLAVVFAALIHDVVSMEKRCIVFSVQTG
jgi:Adenylate and Guanylate cyclase catalytic domain